MGYLGSLMLVLSGLALVCLACPRPAHAYLDPGTGSYVLQLSLAALLGAGFAVKVFWKEIKVFLGGLFAREGEREEAEE